MLVFLRFNTLNNFVRQWEDDIFIVHRIISFWMSVHFRGLFHGQRNLPENQFSILLEASLLLSEGQEFQVVITIDTTTRGEVLPGLLMTMKGQSLHAQIGWWLGELFCFWRLLLFTASTIWTLTRWTLDTSTGTAEPPTTSLVSAQQYLFSIYLYYLHLGFGLPGQCQVGCLVAALWEK